MDAFTNLGCRYSNWWHHEFNITTTYSTISETWPNKITWWRAFPLKLYTIPTLICKRHPNFCSTFIALATLVTKGRKYFMETSRDDLSALIEFTPLWKQECQITLYRLAKKYKNISLYLHVHCKKYKTIVTCTYCYCKCSNCFKSK